MYNANPYGAVREMIEYYRANSNEPSFHLYLDRVAEMASKGTERPEKLWDDMAANYKKYLEYANAGRIVNNDYVKNYGANDEKRTNIEIKVGAGILSVIGSVFVLVALAYFGALYLDDFFKGVVFFAAGIVVILVSELLVARKFAVFSQVITGLGFGVLYFATIYSYLKLDMYNLYVCVGIFVAIGLINLLLARIRKSQIMEIVCSLGSAVPLFAVAYVSITLEAYIVMLSLVLIVNLLLFIAPYKPGYAVSKIFRAGVVFASIVFVNAKYSDDIEHLWYAGGVCAVLLVLFIAYAFNTQDMVFKCVSLSLIGITSLMIIGSDNYYVHAAFAGVCLVSFLILVMKKERFSPITLMFLYATVYVLINNGFGNDLSDRSAIFILLGIIVFSKLCALSRDFAISDAVITFGVLVQAVFLKSDYFVFAIWGVAFLGLFVCPLFKLYHEFVFGLLGYAFILLYGFDHFTVLIGMSYLLVLMVMFNLIGSMRVNGIVAYNLVSLLLMAGNILLAPANDYDGYKEIVVVASAAFIGLLTCVIVLRKPFGLDTPGRYIIMSAILTYLGLFLKVDPLWISISLMIVAFLTIAVGCIANRFEVRIYGLVLSLLICIKVAFWDFKNSSDFNRMIVFLVVGLLAIAISFVYMLLESHEQKLKRAGTVQPVQVQPMPVQPVQVQPMPVQPMQTPITQIQPPMVDNMPLNSDNVVINGNKEGQGES